MGFLKRFLSILSAQPEPCMTCGQSTKEVLVREGREWVRYCRVHLLEEFARGLEKSPYRMVVYEFQPQATKYTGSVYAYYPVSTLGEFNWPTEEADKLRRILQEIDPSQSCQSCGGNPWQVAYFDGATAPWQRGSSLSEVGIDRALRLCTRCAALKMGPVLRENPKEFDEGLYLPYQEDGMYATTEM
jgi:hypothetical protein